MSCHENPITKKKKSKKQQPTNRVKMITGYIIYASEIRKEIIKKNPEKDFGGISKIVGQEWKNLPQEIKVTYEKKAQDQNNLARDKLLLLPEMNVQQQQPTLQAPASHHHGPLIKLADVAVARAADEASVDGAPLAPAAQITQSVNVDHGQQDEDTNDCNNNIKMEIHNIKLEHHQQTSPPLNHHQQQQLHHLQLQQQQQQQQQQAAAAAALAQQHQQQPMPSPQHYVPQQYGAPQINGYCTLCCPAYSTYNYQA